MLFCCWVCFFYVVVLVVVLLHLLMNIPLRLGRDNPGQLQAGLQCILFKPEVWVPTDTDKGRSLWFRDRRNVIFLLSFYLSLKMKRFAFLFWRTVCPMKSWRQWQRCTKWRIAQMLRWAHKHILRISVEHWALGMDVIHSNTNENMRISIKGNVTKRMPKKWICCQWSVCLYHKNPLECF